MNKAIVDGTKVFVKCAEEYLDAVAALGQIKDGITLFETSPTKDEDAFNAWVNLNNKGARLRECVNRLKQGLPTEKGAE